MMKMLWHATGMFLLGAAALLVPGLLFEARVAEPLPMPEGGPVGTTGALEQPGADRTDVAGLAVRGVAADLRAAADALGSNRDTAPMLLDASHRLADVLRYAVPSAPSERLYDLVIDARQRLQNGDPDGARRAAIDAAGLAVSVAGHSARHLPVSDSYEGAVVLTPTGEHVGTVAGIDSDRIVIDVARGRDILGFIDLQPRVTRVLHREQILFGEARAVGYTLVVSAAQGS